MVAMVVVTPVIRGNKVKERVFHCRHDYNSGDKMFKLKNARGSNSK